jgi:AhpD family alkylhydroperoxidase
VVAEVYRQVERDFSMLAPPVALHSASPEVLAAAWAVLRETLLADGVASRADKEAVATGVSLSNSCPYCADVHGMTLAAIGSAATSSSLEGWARSAVGAPPCSVESAPELIGVAVAFQYYNRMVNVFLRESPFPAHVPESAKPRARRVLGGVLRPGDAGALPGSSLALLPSVPLVDELAWARGNPVVADAFARSYTAVEAAGRRSVPDGVRALVLRRLSAWDGAAPGISRGWVSDAVSGLPVDEQAAGRLALVIALASYQVDEELVSGFRVGAGGDDTLVEFAAWVSMAAARRVSAWIAVPGEGIRTAGR